MPARVGVLHLRVIVPEDLREPVLSVLRGEVGVANLLLYPGASLEPAGDEITADIARECANDVIKELKALEVQHRGAITLSVLDTVLSTRAHTAEDAADGDAADALVWDELITRTREEATLSVTFVIFPDPGLPDRGDRGGHRLDGHRGRCHGARTGIRSAGRSGVALVKRRLDLARRAALALLVGFPVAMAITAVATLAGQAVGWLGLDAVRDVTEVDFIFQVGPISFVVALLAGAAGMLSLVSSKSAALVGVFISVTTVPAAGFAVVAAILGDWDVAAQSAAQLGVNLVGIVMAGVLVLIAPPAGHADPAFGTNLSSRAMRAALRAV